MDVGGVGAEARQRGHDYAMGEVGGPNLDGVE